MQNALVNSNGRLELELYQLYLNGIKIRSPLSLVACFAAGFFRTAFVAGMRRTWSCTELKCMYKFEPHTTHQCTHEWPQRPPTHFAAVVCFSVRFGSCCSRFFLLHGPAAVSLHSLSVRTHLRKKNDTHLTWAVSTLFTDPKSWKCSADSVQMRKH